MTTKANLIFRSSLQKNIWRTWTSSLDEDHPSMIKSPLASDEAKGLTSAGPPKVDSGVDLVSINGPTRSDLFTIHSGFAHVITSGLMYKIPSHHLDTIDVQYRETPND